jgi:hypothetical protein
MAGKGKPPPFQRNNKAANDGNKKGKGQPFGGKRAALFNGRKPPRRGK